MKKLIVTTIIASAVASSALAQGLVTFSGGGNAATKVSTNSVVGGAATGVVAGANNYYFALFASTTQTAAAGSGASASYVFSNLGAPSSAWELVGIGANSASAGRFTAVSQGSTSANQGAINADNSLTVQGIGGGSAANLIAIGWSANIGTTLASVIAWYNNGNVATTGWIGQSAVTTGATLGDGNLVLTPAWSTAPTFLLGEVAPVPEPTTLALAAIGGASLLMFRRKK